MQGKIALITGASRRVGAQIARALHGQGMNLMVHYHNSAEAARALQDELDNLRPDSVSLIQADLLDTTLLPSLVSQTVASFGRLDVLINNASSFYPTLVGNIVERDWVDLMGPNLKAPLFFSQAGGQTKALARELGPEVGVNAVAPGPIVWPEADPNFDELSRQRIISNTILKTAGEPKDIALAVRFLVCDAPYVTGQVIAVDGGRSARL